MGLNLVPTKRSCIMQVATGLILHLQILASSNSATPIRPFWRELEDINRYLYGTKDSQLIIG
jgi:hypothetical protein